jgi:hypothetical protein
METPGTFPIRPRPKPPSKNLAVGGSGGGGPAYGGPARGCRTRQRGAGRGITEQNKKHVKNKESPTTSKSPRPRPPGVPRPPVLTDVHDLPDDLDWLTAVDETITARSPQQPGPCPSPTAQQARPWPDRPQAESHDELLTELVHSAETARPWQKNELNDKHITPTPTPRRDKTASPGRRARTP